MEISEWATEIMSYVLGAQDIVDKYIGQPYTEAMMNAMHCDLAALRLQYSDRGIQVPNVFVRVEHPWYPTPKICIGRIFP